MAHSNGGIRRELNEGTVKCKDTFKQSQQRMVKQSKFSSYKETVNTLCLNGQGQGPELTLTFGRERHFQPAAWQGGNLGHKALPSLSLLAYLCSTRASHKLYSTESQKMRGFQDAASRAQSKIEKGEKWSGRGKWRLLSTLLNRDASPNLSWEDLPQQVKAAKTINLSPMLGNVGTRRLGMGKQKIKGSSQHRAGVLTTHCWSVILVLSTYL